MAALEEMVDGLPEAAAAVAAAVAAAAAAPHLQVERCSLCFAVASEGQRLEAAEVSEMASHYR